MIIISVILIISVFVYYSTEYKQQEQPAILSGFFVHVFNISNGEEVYKMPSNITEADILCMGYEIIHINTSVLEDYPLLKNCLKEDGKHIDLTDEEAALIIRNFRGKVVEYNKNYYEIVIGQY